MKVIVISNRSGYADSMKTVADDNVTNYGSVNPNYIETCHIDVIRAAFHCNFAVILVRSELYTVNTIWILEI